MTSRSVHPDIEPPADGSASTASTPKARCGASEVCADWQNARDRVLLYLRSLNMPPILGLSIALDVLRRAVAKRDPATTEVHPTRAAMLSLREVLSERSLYPQTRAFWDRDRIFCTAESVDFLNAAAGTLPETAARSGDLPVTPPINRGRMLPEFIDRKPVRSFFGRLLRRRPAPGRPASSRRSSRVPPGAAAGRQPPEVEDDA